MDKTLKLFSIEFKKMVISSFKKKDIDDPHFLKFFFLQAIILTYVKKYHLFNIDIINNDFLGEIKDLYHFISEPLVIPTTFEQYMISFEAEAKELIKFAENNHHYLTSIEDIEWIYQYFQDDLFQELSNYTINNQKIPLSKQQIKTQVFTPDYIVKYLAKNSLYYVIGKEQIEDESFVIYQKKNNSPKKIDDIKVIDPAMGSGLLLFYMYDLLEKEYIERGYDLDLIPLLITNKNLYGLDIDDSVVQFVRLLLKLKIRTKQPNFSSFNQLTPHFFTPKSLDNESKLDKINELREITQKINIIGSLFRLETQIDLQTLLTMELTREERVYIEMLIVLTSKYDIYLTNPPYMGRKSLANELRDYIKNYYPLAKSEIYAAFIMHGLDSINDNGVLAMITIHTFMFISSFFELRSRLLKYQFHSFIHLGARTFFDMRAFNVLASSFIIIKENPLEQTIFVDLTSYDYEQKMSEFYNQNNYYYLHQTVFNSLDSNQFIYRFTDKTTKIINDNHKLGDIAQIRQGLATGDNKEFVRFWFEVPRKGINFSATSVDSQLNSPYLYVPYNKGGKFRKWYGMNEYVIKFDLANYEKLKTTGNHLPSREFYFKEGITYSLFGFENFHVRYKPKGFVFDVSGSSIFTTENIFYLLGYLTSNVAFYFLKNIAPTVNYQVGDLERLPYIRSDNQDWVIKLVKENISLVKYDWDLKEISFDYQKPKFFELKDIEIELNNYCQYVNKSRIILQENEEKINAFFISLFSIDNIDKEVMNRDLSIRELSIEAAFNELIGYLIGVIFGRYKHKDYEFPDELLSVDDVYREIVKLLGNDHKNLLFIAKMTNSNFRKYFLDSFYSYHLKLFRNHPLYFIDKNEYVSYYFNMKLNDIEINYDTDILSNMLNNKTKLLKIPK